MPWITIKQCLTTYTLIAGGLCELVSNIVYNMANGDVSTIDHNDYTVHVHTYMCVLLKPFAVRLKTQPYRV